MLRWLWYLVQPGVLTTGLIGTALQVGLGFADATNLAGVSDTIAQYGLGGQLASGGLVAAITGMLYSVSQRSAGRAVATGAGAAAGGISGVLGVGLSQALGINPVPPGAEPLIDFTAVGTGLMGLVGLGATGDPAIGIDQMLDTVAASQTFGATAAGGGVGAFLMRMIVGRS